MRWEMECGGHTPWDKEIYRRRAKWEIEYGSGRQVGH